MRILVLLTIALALIAPALAADCAGRAEKKVRFSNNAVPDTFVVESFGKTCADAKVLIYVTTVEEGWHALHITELSNITDAPVTPATLKKALDGIAARIEGLGRSPLETWDSLQKAGKDGNPWRGTPLVKDEYERLFKARPRAIIIPTDPARGMMWVWDAPGGMLKRPVPFIYYGD
jgi:hypothetical protein